MGFIVDLALKKKWPANIREKKEENLVTNFEFLGGPMSCFVFQDIFFYVVSGKLREGEAFCQKKKIKKKY